MYPLLQTNFEILSYFTDLTIGGLALIITTLGLAVSIYTFLIAKKAMNDWQIQRNYDIIIESLVEVDNLYQEIQELRTPPDRPWNMYAQKAYISQPSYMNSIIGNPLYFKYGRKKQNSYDTIIKKLELQLGDNQILDFLRTNTQLIQQLEEIMEYYAEKEHQGSPSCYDDDMKGIWNYIFNTTTDDLTSEKVNKEYLIAKEWGESKIKSLRSNI